VDALSEAKAQTGWSVRPKDFADLTTNWGFALSGSRFAPGAPASIKLSRHPSSAREGNSVPEFLSRVWYRSERAGSSHLPQKSIIGAKRPSSVQFCEL